MESIFSIKILTLKNYVMGNLLYLIAIVLIILWALGLYVGSFGNLIHLLLAIAVIAILLRIINGSKKI